MRWSLIHPLGSERHDRTDGKQQRKKLEEFNKALVASATVIPLVTALPENEPRKKTLLALLQANARECQRLKAGLE
jgi:hypothetical protein